MQEILLLSLAGKPSPFLPLYPGGVKNVSKEDKVKGVGKQEFCQDVNCSYSDLCRERIFSKLGMCVENSRPFPFRSRCKLQKRHWWSCVRLKCTTSLDLLPAVTSPTLFSARSACWSCQNGRKGLTINLNQSPANFLWINLNYIRNVYPFFSQYPRKRSNPPFSPFSCSWCVRPTVWSMFIHFSIAPRKMI